MYMHQISIDLPGALGTLERTPRSGADLDLGYLAHSCLASSFRDEAPSPFWIAGCTGRRITILGYATTSADAIAGRRPEYMVDHRSKVMPRRWPVGMSLDFDVRVCPIVRVARTTPHHRKGAEVDAFLAAVDRTRDSSQVVDREGVYATWVKDALTRSGGVRIESVRVLAYTRERLTRLTQGRARTARRLERPSVEATGRLVIEDADAFQRTLIRGVGRHRAFGFGMLRLRPVRGPA